MNQSDITLEKIVYNIINIASGGRSTHNEHLAEPQIEQWVHDYRALFIRRDQSRRRRQREFEQRLDSLQLSEYDDYLRTEPLPQLVRLADREAVSHAGPDEFTAWQVVDNHSVLWRGFSKYVDSDPFVFVMDDRRIYVANSPDTEELTVRGMFENPSRVQSFLVENEQTEHDDEWRYPLPADLIEPLIKAILQTELNITKQMPLDTKLDTLPDEKAVAGRPQD